MKIVLFFIDLSVYDIQKTVFVFICHLEDKFNLNLSLLEINGQTQWSVPRGLKGIIETWIRK